MVLLWLVGGFLAGSVFGMLLACIMFSRKEDDNNE